MNIFYYYLRINAQPLFFTYFTTAKEKIKTKIADFCYSIKAIHKFLDEDGKKKAGIYIVLDKQKQLNQEFFMKTLENIIEMSEQTNRFLIKAF